MVRGYERQPVNVTPATAFHKGSLAAKYFENRDDAEHKPAETRRRRADAGGSPGGRRSRGEGAPGWPGLGDLLGSPPLVLQAGGGAASNLLAGPRFLAAHLQGALPPPPQLPETQK
jgi:hypothetical protein